MNKNKLNNVFYQKRRLISIITCSAMLLTILVFSNSVIGFAEETPEPEKFTPASDTCIRDDLPDDDRSGASYFFCRPNKRETFMRFNISTATDYLNAPSIRLKIMTRQHDNKGGQLAVLGLTGADKTSWEESTLTWNTAGNLKSAGTIVAQVPSENMVNETWYDLDVTTYAKAQADGVLAFRIINNASADSTVQIYSSNTTAKSPQITVSYDIDDASAVAITKNELTLGDISAVMTNLVLPLEGSNETSIEWSSDNTAVISNTGVVTRPAENEMDVVVNLTATISRGSATSTKIFTVTVKKQQFSYSFNASVSTEIRDDMPDANRESASYLFCSLGKREAYLRFNLENFYAKNEADLVKLRFNTRMISMQGELKILALSSNDKTSWNAGTLTWNTAGDLKSSGEVVAVIPAEDILQETWYEVDVTDYVTAQQDGICAFRFVCGTPEATLQINSAVSANKPQLVIIPELDVYEDLDDVEAVSLAKYALDIDGAQGIIDDINFPASRFGTTVLWSSGNSVVIKDDGTVTRPQCKWGRDSLTVSLTASISRGSATQTRTMPVSVLTKYILHNPILVTDYGKEIQQLELSEYIDAFVTLYNQYNTDTSVTIIVALYDKEYKLISAGYDYKTVIAGEDETLDVRVYMPEVLDNHYIKIFAWDGINTMIPLEESLEFN